MAAFQAMGVPGDSSLRNLEQIPFPEPYPVQNPSSASDTKDTPSMKELVQEIDSYVEAMDLEVTSTFDVALHTTPSAPLNYGVQPAKDVQTSPSSAVQPAIDTQSSSTVEIDPTAQA